MIDASLVVRASGKCLADCWLGGARGLGDTARQERVHVARLECQAVLARDGWRVEAPDQVPPRHGHLPYDECGKLDTFEKKLDVKL